MRDKQDELVEQNAAALDRLCSAAREAGPAGLKELAGRAGLSPGTLLFAVGLQELDPQIVKLIGRGKVSPRRIEALARQRNPAYNPEVALLHMQELQNLTGARQLLDRRRKEQQQSNLHTLDKAMRRK